MHRSPRSLQALTLLLAGALAVAPGCRAVGRESQGFYEASAGAFIRNPATFVPFHLGLGVGIVAGAPLLLISWPLAALFGPSFDGGYAISARLAPSLALGTLLGDLLSLPFWPFGLPFEPDPPAAHLAGEPEDG